MKKFGRCGRQRRSKHKSRVCQGVSQAHMPEYVSLLQWMKVTVGSSQWKSSVWHCLEPAYFKDTGRGLRATKNINPGETIVSIPLELLITTSTVFDSHVGSVLLKANKHFTPQQLLTIFLLIERYQGDKSAWFPYMNSLPQTYSTTLYFSEKEINSLTPHVRSSAVLAEDRFSKAFDKIKNFFQNNMPSMEHMCSESDVRWAWSTVNTRSVYFQTSPHPLLILDPEESHVALAPFLDLLNHHYSSQMSAGINSRSSCYDIVSLDTYKKHDQVFICYGAHNNAMLLINYGFTLPCNIHNSYVFTLEEISTCIRDHTPLVNDRLNIIKDTQLVNDKLNIIRDTQLDKNLVCTVDGASWSLVTALKISSLQKEQLSLWKTLFQGAILSEENEEMAKKMASQLIRLALNREQRHLEYLEIQPKSTNYELVRNLSLDDIQILESSQSSLKVDQH